MLPIKTYIVASTSEIERTVAKLVHLVGGVLLIIRASASVLTRTAPRVTLVLFILVCFDLAMLPKRCSFAKRQCLNSTATDCCLNNSRPKNQKCRQEESM